MTTKGGVIFDIRKESEFEGNHVENARNTPLENINDWIDDARETDTFFVHCAGGDRSMMAASILKSRGIHNFKEIEGGFGAIKNVMESIV